MTEHYTDIGKNQNLSIEGLQHLKQSGKEASGTVLFGRPVFTGNTLVQKDDVIKLLHVGTGVTIVPHLSAVIAESLGTGFTVSIGTEDDPERWGKDIDLSTAGVIPITGGTEAVEANPTDKPTWIIATVTAVSGPIDGAKAQFGISYTLP